MEGNVNSNWILIRLPESGNQTYILIPGETTLGRGITNTIKCTSLMVSRFHCIITLKPCGNVYLRDLGSSNGTFINAEKSLTNRDVLLMEGDIIGLGVDILNPSNDEAVFVLKLHKLSSQINIQQSRENFPETIPVEKIIIDDIQDQAALKANRSVTVGSKHQATTQLPETSKSIESSVVTTFQNLCDVNNEQSREISSTEVSEAIPVEEIIIDDIQVKAALEANSSATVKSKHQATTQFPKCSKILESSVVAAFQKIEDISNERCREISSTEISEAIPVEEIDDIQDKDALEPNSSVTVRSKHQVTTQLPECSKRLRSSVVTGYQELKDISNEQCKEASSTKILEAIPIKQVIIDDVQDQAALETNSSTTVRSKLQVTTQLPECLKTLRSSVSMVFQEMQDINNEQSTDTKTLKSTDCDVTSSSKNTSSNFVFTRKNQYVQDSSNNSPDIITVSDTEEDDIVCALKNMETNEIVCVNKFEINRNIEKELVTAVDKIDKGIENIGRSTDSFEREMKSCQGDLTKKSKPTTDLQNNIYVSEMQGRNEGNSEKNELEELRVKEEEEDSINVSSSYTVRDNIIIIDSDDEMPPSQLFVDPDIENKKEENDIEEIVDRLSNEDGYPLTSDDDNFVDDNFVDDNFDDDAQEWYQKLSQQFKDKVDNVTEKTLVEEKEVESSINKIDNELQIMDIEEEENFTDTKSIDTNNQHKVKLPKNLDLNSKVDIVGISSTSNKSKKNELDNLLKVRKRKSSDDYTPDLTSKKTKINLPNKKITPSIEVEEESKSKTNNMKKKISSKEGKNDHSLKHDKKNVVNKDKEIVKGNYKNQTKMSSSSSSTLVKQNDEIERILAEKICEDFLTHIGIAEKEKKSKIKKTEDILENKKVNEIKQTNDRIKHDVVPRRRTISTEALPKKTRRSKSETDFSLSIASTSFYQASVPKEKNDSHVSYPVDKNYQKTVKELRKEKLKELTKKNVQSCTSENKKPKLSASTNIKLTLKNRGAFLADGIVTEPKNETNSVSTSKDGKITRRNSKNGSHKNEKLSDLKANSNHSSNNVKQCPPLTTNKFEKKEVTMIKISSEHTELDKTKSIRHNKTSFGNNKNNTNIELNDEPYINDKFNKGLSDNAHNNLKSILRKSSSNEILPQQFLKASKKVQFEKEENLVKINFFECLGNLVRKPTSYNVKDALPPENVPINGQHYEIHHDMDHSSIIVICCICHCNYIWLEEQKKMPSNIPPPVFDGEIFDCKDEYSSFQDIKYTLFPLLMYELWGNITTAWDQIRKDVFTIISMENNNTGLLQCFKVRNPLSSEKTLVYINCQTLLSNADLNSNIYPRVGDFVVAEFCQIGDTKNDGKRTCIGKTVFGYIYRANPNKITPHTNHINKDLMIKHPNAKIALDMVMIVRGPTFVVDQSRLGRIHIVKNLIPFLRNFKALDNLQFSPLLNRILSPAVNNCMKMTDLPNIIPYKDAPSLNDSQRKAVQVIAKACLEGSDSLHLIHGPPGTGKTQVIVSLVMQLWLTLCGKKHKEPPRILICAPSNAAIDEISLRLVKIRQTFERSKQFNLIRNGRKESVDHRLQGFILDAITTRDINKNLNSLKNTEMSEIEENISDAKINSLKFSFNSLNESQGVYSLQETQQKKLAIQKKLADAVRRKEEINNYIKTKKIDHHTFKGMKASREIEVLENANIITTTLSSSFNSVMEKTFSGNSKAFTCCIIDEATQAMEPETFIPLLMKVNNLILVGDPRQLPATILNMCAKKRGLDKSLFSRHRMWWYKKERSWYSENRLMHFLDEQYRMHPEIVQWPSEYFYNNALLTGCYMESKRKSTLLPYVILSHTCDQDPNGELNFGELRIVRNLVESIVNSEDCRYCNIGVITPYNKHRNPLTSDLRKFKEVEVGTVDSFQGRERDIIIFSCVRTNGIGFLSDMQRLNVALTRARFSLIICGNFKSLKRDEMWASLLKNAEKRNVLKNIDMQETNFSPFNLITRRIM